MSNKFAPTVKGWIWKSSKKEGEVTLYNSKNVHFRKSQWREAIYSSPTFFRSATGAVIINIFDKYAVISPLLELSTCKKTCAIDLISQL